jgi:hypothetical protein
MIIVKYPRTVVTSATTVNAISLILNNKVLVPLAYSQYVRLSGLNATIYEFDKSKDLRSSVTVTDHVSITNPNNDNDYNDNSFINVTGAGDFRTYDLGEVKDVFLNIKHSAGTSSTSIIRISNDASTWTTISSITDVSNVFVSALYTCRYIRWSGTGSSGWKSLSTVEIFDINNYTARTNGTGNSMIEHEIVTKNDIHWICLKADSMMTYYQYKISRIEKIINEVEVI